LVQAAAIIDGEWLAAGMTPQEIARDKELADLFSRLLASGWAVDALLAEWEGKSADEILASHGVGGAPVLDRAS
jgi:hypothetical protein